MQAFTDLLPPANEVWGKVGGGGLPQEGGLPPGVGQTLLPPSNQKIGRYASYWNVFLSRILFLLVMFSLP